MKKSIFRRSTFTVALALVLSLCMLVGCSKTPAKTDGSEKVAGGGVLVLSVNPKIAVQYDENGNVTAVDARNEDAKAIIENCGELVGKETREAVGKLVEAIGSAGYFVEEIEGENRKITIELEEGSKLPSEAFIKDIVSDIRDYIKSNEWNTLLDVKDGSDYGLTDDDDINETDDDDDIDETDDDDIDETDDDDIDDDVDETDDDDIDDDDDDDKDSDDEDDDDDKDDVKGSNDDDDDDDDDKDDVKGSNDDDDDDDKDDNKDSDDDDDDDDNDDDKDSDDDDDDDDDNDDDKDSDDDDDDDQDSDDDDDEEDDD